MAEAREKLDASLLVEEKKETSLLVEQETAHSEISRKRRMQESARDKLKREYEKIERILISLTNAPSKKLIRKTSMRGTDQGDGKGLGHYSKWPVEGTIVHKYGQYRVSTFKDVVFHKGVLFDSPPGTLVRALEEGVVRFIGIMPKYGLVLLLDHGRREYSLYGKLSEARVSIGSEVSQDQILGTAGQKGKDEEGSFYFEVRHGGKPVNPDQYVRVSSRS
jgi:septal ring factor EnvC (AmiA/AmiB activator)